MIKMENKLIRMLKKIKGRKILVIGDVMIDKYIWGTVKRISPEAPVPVLNVSKETFVPGGAANSAYNISTLGGKSILVGVVGNDKQKEVIKRLLTKGGVNTKGLVVDESRHTILKERIIAQGQQLMRIDYEKKEIVSKKIASKIIEKVTKFIKEVDAVLISDYAKGMHSPDIMGKIILLGKKHKKPVLVDSKFKNYMIYENCDYFLPNHEDASMMTGIEEKDETDTKRIGSRLGHHLNTTVLMTCGEKGMYLFEKKLGMTHIPTKAREVYDVSGAGDTVASIFSMGIGAKLDIKDSALLATHAASVVIGKVGTATVSLSEIEKDILLEQNKGKNK